MDTSELPPNSPSEVEVGFQPTVDRGQREYLGTKQEETYGRVHRDPSQSRAAFSTTSKPSRPIDAEYGWRAGCGWRPCDWVITEALETRQESCRLGGIHVWRGRNGQGRKWSRCSFARFDRDDGRETKEKRLPLFWTKLGGQWHNADLLPPPRISHFDPRSVPRSLGRRLRSRLGT